MVGQVLRLFARQIDKSDALELVFTIASDINALAITAELRVAECHAVVALLRREERLLTARRVNQPEVALIDGDPLEQEDLPVIGRPIRGRPTATLQLRYHAIACGVGWVHYPDVQVAPVAPRGHVRIPVALVRPGAAHIARLAVREQRDVPGGGVIAILLEELGPPDVLGEHDVTAVGRLVRRARYGVGEERELRAVTAGRPHPVQLGHVAKPGPDDHLAPRGVPVPERRRAELAVGARRLGNDRGHRGYAVGHEIVVRGHDAGLGEYRARQGQGESDKQTSTRGHENSDDGGLHERYADPERGVM